MRIGRYEFGLERPIKWRKFEHLKGACGCDLYSWGFWYFTILRYECAGEPDDRTWN